MIVLNRRHGLSLPDAKAAVHDSDAWADRRDADNAFHAEFERLLRERS